MVIIFMIPMSSKTLWTRRRMGETVTMPLIIFIFRSMPMILIFLGVLGRSASFQWFEYLLEENSVSISDSLVNRFPIGFITFICKPLLLLKEQGSVRCIPDLLESQGPSVSLYKAELPSALLNISLTLLSGKLQ